MTYLFVFLSDVFIYFMLFALWEFLLFFLLIESVGTDKKGDGVAMKPLDELSAERSEEEESENVMHVAQLLLLLLLYCSQ